MLVAARTRRPSERGIGSLAVVLMLLMGTSIGLLYINRSVLFEHRTSANQTQTALVADVAEAGVEWATGMLNAPYDIGTDCAFLTTTNLSFRKRYVLTKFNDLVAPTTDVVAATQVFPGCKITSAGLNCNCPASPSAGSSVVANLGSSADPSFTVAFQNVASDPEAVQLTVYACSAQSAACASTNFSTADGNARYSVTLKLRPLLRAAPSAPLTAGTSASIGGSYNIVNQDVASNGILVNAGTTISIANGVTVSTLQGQPASSALVGADASLSALASTDTNCTNSQMFNAYFGSTIEQYQASPSTKTISCASAADCRSRLGNAYDDGWRAFYFSSSLQLSGNLSFGSQSDPITIVTSNAINVNGNVAIFGLIFSNDANWNDLGTGSATIHGAQVSCAAYNNNGNGTLQYDPLALSNVRRMTGILVRVPGSWRDFKTSTDTLP